MAGFEFPKKLYLEPVPWSVDNELLTPSFKLKRPSLVTKYKTEIEQYVRLWSCYGRRASWSHVARLWCLFV